jgi:hypothetical protein
MIINIPISRGVSSQQVSDILAGRLNLCVRLKVTYRDAFSPHRYANFGYMVDAVGFRFLPKYHDSN